MTTVNEYLRRDAPSASVFHNRLHEIARAFPVDELGKELLVFQDCPKPALMEHGVGGMHRNGCATREGCRGYSGNQIKHWRLPQRKGAERAFRAVPESGMKLTDGNQ